MSGRPGQVQRTPLRSNQGRSRMWQAMRVLRRFTAPDLIATAEVGDSAAAKYVRYLLRAGYLRCVVAKVNGRTGGHAHYRLVKDTGPFAPRVGKHAVRDPNLEPTRAEPTVSIPRSEYDRALRCISVCEGIRAFGVESATVTRATDALEVAR